MDENTLGTFRKYRHTRLGSGEDVAASKTCTIEIFISDHYVFIINEPPSYFYSFGKNLRQHRTIAEASAVESPIRQETIGFPAHFFARAHNFKPPGRACQPKADSPMRT